MFLHGTRNDKGSLGSGVRSHTREACSDRRWNRGEASGWGVGSAVGLRAEGGLAAKMKSGVDGGCFDESKSRRACLGAGIAVYCVRGWWGGMTVRANAD